MMINIVKRLSKIKLLKDRVLKLLGTYEEPKVARERGCCFVEDEWDESGYHLEINNASNQLPNNGTIRINADDVPWEPEGKRILVTFYHQDNGNGRASS